MTFPSGCIYFIWTGLIHTQVSVNLFSSACSLPSGCRALVVMNKLKSLWSSDEEFSSLRIAFAALFRAGKSAFGWVRWIIMINLFFNLVIFCAEYAYWSRPDYLSEALPIARPYGDKKNQAAFFLFLFLFFFFFFFFFFFLKKRETMVVSKHINYSKL